ncbi:hypothetical protein [Nocardiopsis sp. CC223A]|uniref:hypothetical protein n=1 Tax=Nocardiopsis sp. CC223A TaxID=3044051 RepID=UPI00278BD676|nr:hypothetical protein [Nocardiopsis sp. CC223A]
MAATRGWIRGDTGPVAPVTVRPQRVVLAVVHSHQSGDRICEFVGELERDPRVQVVWTLAPGALHHAGGAAFMRTLDAAVLPWEDATSFTYDLALAANHGRLDEVRAPVLVLPHGTGFSRSTARGFGYGPPVARPVGGAVYGALVRYGRLVPAALGIAHERQRAQITAVVPEADGIIEVVGDPAFDRAAAALPDRSRLRRAAGVGEAEHLTVVTSSAGRTGLFGVRPHLVDRLCAQAPDDHVIALILHPGVWWAHGPRQVLAWLSGARARGLRVLAPASPWSSLLVAADTVIGDSGSVTAYAAALGVPTLLAGGGLTDVVPGSTPEALYRVAAHLRDDEPLPQALAETARRWTPGHTARVAGHLTSAPGQSAELLRALTYRMMRLPEPGRPAVPPPPGTPWFVGDGITEGRAA